MGLEGVYLFDRFVFQLIGNFVNHCLVNDLALHIAVDFFVRVPVGLRGTHVLNFFLGLFQRLQKFLGIEDQVVSEKFVALLFRVLGLAGEESREGTRKLLDARGGFVDSKEGVIDGFEGLPRFVVLFCVFLLFVRPLLVAFSGVGGLLIEIFVAHEHFFRLHFKNNNKFDHRAQLQSLQQPTSRSCLPFSYTPIVTLQIFDQLRFLISRVLASIISHNKNKMSHIRNRHQLTTPSLGNNPQKIFRRGRLVASQTEMTPKAVGTSRPGTQHIPKRRHTCEESVYNKNVHHFRDIFNQNDKSQLPFMSSLHNHTKDNSPPKATIPDAFEVSLKTTCNQTVRKKISDFKCQSRRLAFSYYRWHNQTGRNSLWSTDFECSLRYPRENASERNYYNYVKPIVYRDHAERTYDQSEMICERHHRSFSVK